ncbi:MAG: xanthine dehydrogenase family protein molybdopterin-binding subunit [Solirubrobacteraceae bacterium]
MSATWETTGIPAQGAIGQSAPRKEDGPLLTGAARFVGDVHRPGMLHAHILRSPLAHAEIAAIVTAPALAHPDVHAIFTAAELPQGLPPIPMRMFSHPAARRFLQPVLAREVVRYSGEPVAVIIARSRYAAEDAAELVEVDYRPLGPVLDTDVAATAGAPVLHPDAADNVAGTVLIDFGDVDGAFAAAATVVEERLVCHRHAAVPLETRGVVAEFDELDDMLVVYGAAKVPHTNRRILASLLDRPEERIRLIELFVGGGFGARGEFYPEDFLIPYCALALRRPVSWIEDREEHLRACNHSRQQMHDIAVALDADGRFLALQDRVLNDAGAYVRTQGLLLPNMTAAFLPGPYRWPAYRCEARHVVTNKTPAAAFRAPGRYEAHFARERLLDIAAHRIGLDPIELRRRNLLPPKALPYAVGTHTDGHPLVYDSGDYPALLDRALERFDDDALRAWRGGGDARRRRGTGIACYVEKSGVGGWEYARVSVTSRGDIAVHAGSASLGQGIETALAQVCADTLGVDYSRVSVLHGDTATVPDGVGSFGSRSTAMGGSAVLLAARALRERLLGLAAEALQSPVDELRIEGDCVVDSEGESIALTELRGLARPGGRFAQAHGVGLQAEAYARCDEPAFPYGVQCAAVEVDLDTGAISVHRHLVALEIGRAINPALITGQLVGGAVQGIGGALLEELAYNDEGELVSGTLVNYLLPLAADIPTIDVLVCEDVPTTTNPLGVRGAGESGIAAAGAAIANAISDALGAEVLALPVTPERAVKLAATAAAR